MVFRNVLDTEVREILGERLYDRVRVRKDKNVPTTYNEFIQSGERRNSGNRNDKGEEPNKGNRTERRSGS